MSDHQCPECGSPLPENGFSQSVDCRVCGWTTRTGLGLAGSCELPMPCAVCLRVLRTAGRCPECDPVPAIRTRTASRV